MAMGDLEEAPRKWQLDRMTSSNISQQSIGKHRIVLPPFEIIQKFESVVDELFARIDTSSIQSEKLSEIRDALLPRLMSGELSVS